MKHKHVRSAVALAILFGLSGCNSADTNKVTSLKESKKVAQVIKIGNPSLQTTKHFSGVINSQNIAGLAFRVPGTIDSLLVAEGDFVNKGDLLATLDKHDYQVTLEELQAKLMEAKSAHRLANNELKRIEQARKDDAIATVNLDRAVSAYERSLAMVNVVKKNIERAQDALNYTELRAPFSGLVGAIAYEQYEQILPGISILALQSPNDLQIEIDVPENLVSGLQVGKEAVVSWYGAETEIPAVISEVSPFPHLIKQTYIVKLDLSQAHDDLFIGKALTVSINTHSKDSAYCLPYSALAGAGDTLYVNTVNELTVHSIPVDATELRADFACVKGDLFAGDSVVVTGTKYLKDGEKLSSIVTRSE
ncbi:efflux RND transporter periplasmic adaptor subunit [Vibrio fortis]|uniref:efflux RND transporter periplasmic adaptor subunit n=1 Tax=Vibrio fortis TaxID=212667 RepID=UPI0038CD6461